MRQKYALANWKMNSSLSDAIVLASAIKSGMEDLEGLDVIICPPFTWLYPISEIYEHRAHNLFLGAQNMHYKDNGPFTAEISPLMIKDMVQYVILGHSERRIVFGEDSALVNDKLIAALNHKITPVLCIGEKEEGEEGKLDSSIVSQLRESLDGISMSQMSKIILAYEPVWAISTGDSSSKKNASVKYVSGAIWAIREEIKKLYNEDVAEGLSILYGGSVNKDNIEDYAHLENVDGVLVGAASLNAENFLYICKKLVK
ncbi:MAG: triose-phosphate isomerase [Patescibacteria group bacterium]